jgi:4'-phosphopantetheinyl transferase
MSIMDEHVLYIWVLDWSKYLAKKSVFWQLLSLAERQKAKQFLCRYDQDRFIITRGILRILLGYLLHDVPSHLVLKGNRFGKPELTSGGLHFNLSHSGDQVAYAFCKVAAVGIDIEYCYKINIPITQLVTRYFSQDEAQVFSALPHHEKKRFFFLGWVQKEAIVKSLGYGMRVSLATVEVNIHPQALYNASYRQVINNYFRGCIFPLEVPYGFIGVVALPVISIENTIVKQFKNLPSFE